ncbi:hypothetical protein HYR99_38525, partial [Candidatus Poribacteria bacterium]|nr:hypothetical protein [Candidatus Poribacteria bacterium]
MKCPTQRFIDKQGALQSLELTVSVRRHKPSDFKDVLSITARWAPENTLWTPPEVSVQVEIRDDAPKLLATLQSCTGVPVEWAVPDEVQGMLGIIAKHTDAWGKTHEARFPCQAH